MNTVISDIAVGAREQATGLQQVNTAVNQMDQVTQQNAAMVEQSTAASHAMANEAEELTRLVSRFKTGHEDRTPAAQSERRPQSQPKTQRPRRTLKTTSQLAPAPEASEDGWEEF